MKNIIDIRHLSSSSSVLCFLMTPDMIDLIRGDLSRCVSRERLRGRLDFQGEVKVNHLAADTDGVSVGLLHEAGYGG